MMDGIDAKVERLAQRLLQAGAITDTHADKNFYRRLAAIDAELARLDAGGEEAVSLRVKRERLLIEGDTLSAVLQVRT